MISDEQIESWLTYGTGEHPTDESVKKDILLLARALSARIAFEISDSEAASDSLLWLQKCVKSALTEIERYGDDL